MNAGRSARITLLVAEQAARRGARVGVVDVCTAAVAALPVGGAGVSAMSDTTACHPLCSTDVVSEQMEELQLTLGEGPCIDAFAFRLAVLTPDLRTDEVRARWPVFAISAIEAGAAAVFALPLQIGAISPGVLALYADAPVELDAEELADALAFADAATLVLLDSRLEEPDAFPAEGPPRDGHVEDLGGYRAEIDQATGMLTVQLGVGIEEALVRLRAYAYAYGRRLADVAADVVAHRLRLPPDPDPDPDPDPGPGEGGAEEG
ncbi:ANTAR domain-containing protein [Streptomyces sporangiiformans]|uniref:ANTAR domain-containing protein n=1 Tax=Streptomyces sporangiiformans TaxID=2315329 RepID=A0A505DKW8_9ACTN|nr:ANTAR domain-containing protein [Streptomyces sporangiiformans]TPQ20696.1 ANTAR domain-containing protein [Streptomyces sporangiiformans]